MMPAVSVASESLICYDGSKGGVCVLINIPRIHIPEPKSTGRWLGIDLLKTICSFLVVIIHAPFPGIVGMYITALSRISVPIFFMITGFFYSDVVRRNKEKDQIKKIFLLFSAANVLSTVAGFCHALATGSLHSFVRELATVQTFINFALWNEPLFGRHLWYLGAILYTLVIVYWIRKANAFRWLTLLTPGLLILSLILGKYCIVLLGTQIPYLYVRNFFFMGLPYFLIGHLLYEHRERIFARFTNGIFIACLLLFSISTVVERYVLEINQVNASNDYYISTPFLACTVFLRFAKLRCETQGTLVTVLCRIGKRYSTWIYLLHPMLIGAADFITGERLHFLRPFATFFLTLAICVPVTKLFAKIITKHKRV